MSDYDLLIVARDADGNTKLLDSDGPAGDRPVGIQFSTQLGSGWTTGGWTLHHPIDRERPDLGLYDDITIIGSNGDTAYEGYVAALPRSADEGGHTLSVTTAGWVGHMADEPFTMIFVDRDPAQFAGEPSTARQTGLLTAGYLPQGSGTITPDASGSPGLVQRFDRLANTASQKAIIEAWYDAGPGNLISTLYADMVSYNSGAGSLVAPWIVDRYLVTDDTDVSHEGSTVGPGTYSGSFTATTPRRYAYVHVFLNATVTADGQWSVTWRNLAAYGPHGLTIRGTTPGGVAASDVIEWLIANYCPLLNTNGVQQTTYPIAHLTFRDRSTVYDACLKVNSYHLWNLSVWEGKTVYYQPVDLTDWDWEVRHDDIAGTQIGLQGDTVTDLRNGIVVQYTDVLTGRIEELHPDDYPDLLDTSTDNPANTHSRRRFGDPLVVPFPTTAGDALELGRRQLLEDNAPKAPGSFVVHGRIRDRSGNWQPCWKVRSGDRIRLTSSVSLSDRPRLIGETSYSHDSQSVTIAVDGTMRTMDAYFERQQTALQAAGF